MANENKNIFFTITIGTLVIATLSTVGVYFIFGESAGYFYMLVLAVPTGAISSLLLMILYTAIRS